MPKAYFTDLDLDILLYWFLLVLCVLLFLLFLLFDRPFFAVFAELLYGIFEVEDLHKFELCRWLGHKFEFIFEENIVNWFRMDT